MIAITPILKVFFWSAALFLFYVHFGYPLTLLILSCRGKQKKNNNRGQGEQPLVTVFIAAHNEGSVIREKLDNALGLDYPKGRLEVIVASDGSTDDTNRILDEYRKQGVVVFINERNQGKNAVINQYVRSASGEILVFTDANAIFSSGAVMHLAAHFSNPDAGCVGGKLTYLSGNGLVARGEGIYFRYENIIRKLEGLRGAMVGANGAIYALRRDLFVDIPPHVPNDFFHPLTVLKRGYAVEFEEKAIAYEKPTINRREEFRRKSRIVVRSIAAVMEVRKQYGSAFGKGWFNLLSHKILRWFTLPVIVLLLVVNALLLGQTFYGVVFCLLSLLLGCGLIGYFLDMGGRGSRLFSIPYYFLLINAAAMVGMLDYLRGRRVTTWKQAQTTR